MKRNNLLILILGVFLATSLVNQVQAWPDATIFAQETDTAPTIDGTLSPGEWNTEEETFSHRAGEAQFDEGTVTVTYTIVVLHDAINAYVLIQFELDSQTNFEGNASMGLALSDATIGTMSSTKDRKIAFHNSSSDITQSYDLHNCELSTCTAATAESNTTTRLQAKRDRTPGKLDTVQNFVSSYGSGDGKQFFELTFPLLAPDAEDVAFQEGTHLKVVLNPFQSLYHEEIGHGGIGTADLEITFTEKSFFPRPEGPMDGLAMVFTGLFSLIVIGLSAAFIVTGRNDNLAEKFLRVDITEEMRSKSVIMEIGFYNSSFVSLFSLFYFWLLSLVSVLYGWWANWGFIGLLINFPALLISTYAGYDLIQRNYNPQSLPEEERRNLGKDVEEHNSLWIFPPTFLGLVLFMLVFIGIDVIS